MVTRFAVIKTDNFDSSKYNDVVQNNFKDITQDGISYKMIHAFSKYIDDYDFDYVFDDLDSYNTWLESGVDTTITKVQYDWENDVAYITIADTNFPGPHEFECTDEWTIEDCQTAIDGKFN